MTLNEQDKNPLDNESRLRAIIETAIDGIITIDQRGIIETINPAAAKIFEYAPHEVIGQNIKILMPEPDKSKHDEYIENYQRTGEKKIIGIGREVLGKKKSGTVFPFRLSVSEVFLQNKIIYTGVIHDITKLKEAENAYKKLNIELEERVQQRTSELFDAIKQLKETNNKQRQAEAEVRKALEKEKELNELKSRFVTIASHEFRTPLSTILSSVSLISKYNEMGEKEKIDKHILRIKSSVSNLTGILNDFLSLSKLEEGIISNNPSQFNLHSLAIEINDELTPALKNNQTILCRHNGLEDVYLDKNILKNILLNLLSNASKYSDEGTIIIEISVSQKEINITVKDEGIGIPESDIPFLFTRFFRAHNAGNIQGTGLGLNIVKRYVELLEGNISVESRLGIGTTFKVNIPVLNR
ncbi:PAS domain-containing sensor histidine kinase [Sporocytophaga myxococcoides]|uniref:PAS domain-containing sensor histidine kinase n=1 Tax=Sporocytophaga myxococcoides TaxID=153721 RepID=UPI001E334794|nr:PAS domain-containing sensor histidine kinase [Sporocytophaga myxococcoides]